MNLKPYQYTIARTHFDYEFESIGPKGKIRKIIRYRPLDASGTIYFNLAFGDINPSTGKLDDLTISNNLDHQKILATIAASILDFTNYHRNSLVYARGSTPARTRLYQMGIAANWEQVEHLFYIYGYEDDKGWQSFRKKVNYDAFLARRK